MARLYNNSEEIILESCQTVPTTLRELSKENFVTLTKPVKSSCLAMVGTKALFESVKDVVPFFSKDIVVDSDISGVLNYWKVIMPQEKPCSIL